MNRLADSRRAWLGVKNPVDGIGPGLVKQCRANYEADLLARIEALMDARAGTAEGDELKRLADEWVEHESAATEGGDAQPEPSS